MERKKNSGRAAGRKDVRADSGRHRENREKNRSFRRYPHDREQSYESIPEQIVPEHLLAGRNPVLEALKSGREIEKILLLKGAEGSVIKIEGMARDRGVEIQYVQRSALDRITDGAVHQGAVAYVSEYRYCEINDILRKAEEKGEEPFVIILDGIEDPHNLGAIIRTADAAGAHGVIIPKRRAAVLTSTAQKAAAGAAEYVPVARVTNIARTIEELKEKHLWIAAADMAGTVVWDTDLNGPLALVVGNEGHGISRLVREKCDFTVSFPMLGRINSLNASNAAALLMYEVVRQRRTSGS